MYVRITEPKPGSKNPNSEQFHSRNAQYKRDHKAEEKHTKEFFKDYIK